VIAALRRIPLVALLVAPLALLSALIARSDIPIRVPEAYGVGVTAAAMTPIFLVAPVAAALAAWEAGRLRRSGWHLMPHVRGMPAIALRALLPVFTMAGVALAVAFAARLQSAGEFVVPDPRLIAKSVAIIGAHSYLGFALGLRLPTLVATSSILILDYAWMVLPVASEPLWLRHLNGTWISCCAVYVDVASEAWWAAMVVAAGIATSGFLLMRWRSTPALVFGAVAPLAGAMFLASALVSSMGPDPVRPRSSSELVCAGTAPRVCVWPEHSRRLAEVSGLVASSAHAWGRLGFEVATEYTEQRAAEGPQAVVFGFGPHTRPADIVAGLANRYVPRGRCSAAAPPLRDARDYLRAWMLRSAAVDPKTAGYPPDVTRVIELLDAQPEAEKRAAVERLLRCEAPATT